MSQNITKDADDIEERRVGRPPGAVGDETRRRLLDASKTVFAKSGYKEASNRMIAAAAGITTGAIYHYYSSKQALFMAVHGELQERQLDRLPPELRGNAAREDRRSLRRQFD